MESKMRNLLLIVLKLFLIFDDSNQLDSWVLEQANADIQEG